MKQEQSQSMQKAWSATKQAGFSLVEVILSSAIFVLLVTALVGAYLYGQEATVLAGNRARANMLAEEGLEAVRNIRDPAYTNLTDGTYGLTTTSNKWNLSGSSDVTGIFTRQVIISTVDTKRKLVTANVTWQQNPQRTGSVILSSRLTNWIAPAMGSCLVVNTAGASNPGKTLIGVTLQNTCSSTITIASMSVSWSGGAGGNTLTAIVINGVTVWSGSLDTGLTEDITDTNILANTTIPLTQLTFNKNKNGTTILTFTMTDGTVLTTPSF